MIPTGKKICIVVISLGKGGAERSSSLLSRMLFDKGYQVHLVSITNRIDYEFKGQLLNLGEIVDGGSAFSKVKKYKILRSFLKKEKFDYVIDNRSRSSILKEVVFSKYLYDARNTIYCVRSYNLDIYFPKPISIARYLYQDAYKIVGVSRQITNKIISKYKFKNAITIYNPVESINLTSNSSVDDYILFYGRLVDDVKNITLLIEAYSQSRLSNNNIKLIILGNGPDLEAFKKKVIQLNLGEHVIFLPFINNPFIYVKRAKFTVLTSHYEGFPRSIIESLALGTPVISVNCNSGPKEIIEHEVNGLLVKNHDILVLAKAMDRFVVDTELYNHCKANAEKSIAPFSMDIVAKDWVTLLN